MRYEELQESGQRGIWVRTRDAANGEIIIFKSKDGKTIQAVGNYLLPEKGLAYENDTLLTLPTEARKLPPAEQKKLLKTGQQKVMEALDAYKQSSGISEANWHLVNSVGKAALISLWKNPENQIVAYIKLFNSKSPTNPTIPFFWRNSDFAKDTGYAPDTKVQQRSDLGLKPNKIVADSKNYTAEDLITKIKENMASNTELPEPVRYQIPKLIENIYSGFSELVPGAGEYMSSYEIDLGEVAAPVALLTGHFVSGAYKQVEDQLLKPMGTSWKKIKRCTFPMASNEPLIDSYLVINGSTKLGVSSKDKNGGASASVTSLLAQIEKNPERFEDLKKMKKYRYLFNVLKLIKEKSAVDGPLELGVMYEFITNADVIKIKKALEDPNTKEADLTVPLKKLLKNKIYNPNRLSANYMIGYHLLATVAKLVVQHLNEQSTIVTDFFKSILSRSNMIQVKTKMKKKDLDAGYSDFVVIWPPSFEGEVTFSADTYYYASSKPNGKCTFSIG